MQRFVDHDPEEHYFTLLGDHGDEFRRMAAVRHRDQQHRPQGRALPARDGRHIFGIDHGVSFHAQWKLRTVIWDFGGEPIPASASADLHEFHRQLDTGALAGRLRPLLDRFEIDALQGRVDRLLRSGVLPEPDDSYHCYPWPMV